MNIQLLNKIVDIEIAGLELIFNRPLKEIDRELFEILALSRFAKDAPSLEYVYGELKAIGTQAKQLN